jgi:hypothetical protein
MRPACCSGCWNNNKTISSQGGKKYIHKCDYFLYEEILPFGVFLAVVCLMVKQSSWEQQRTLLVLLKEWAGHVWVTWVFHTQWLIVSWTFRISFAVVSLKSIYLWVVLKTSSVPWSPGESVLFVLFSWKQKSQGPMCQRVYLNTRWYGHWLYFF